MIVRLLERIPQTWQSLLALAGAMMVGWAVQTVVSAQTALPSAVAENTETIDAHTAQINTLERKINQVICLQIANRQNRPYQECIR